MKKNQSVCLILMCIVNVCVGGYPSVCPNIISKSDWNGRPAVKVDYCIIPVEYVVVHHTVTPECKTEVACSKRMRSMQDYHMDVLGYQDIGYNFVAGGDGNIYEGAGWHKVGAHTRKYNSISLGLGFIGDFTRTLPDAKQLQAAKAFLECAVELQELDANYKLIGASQVRDISSPGQTLLNELESWSHFEKNPKKL